MWFYLLVTEDSYRVKFEGKRFSDAKCPGLLLQRSPLKEAEDLLRAITHNSCRHLLTL